MQTSQEELGALLLFITQLLQTLDDEYRRGRRSIEATSAFRESLRKSVTSLSNGCKCLIDMSNLKAGQRDLVFYRERGHSHVYSVSPNQ